ncbi:hypothetical protein C8Q78DRAFT_994696 [Trametes maxima]|nr:hypothetical protein C8Q78DRAFT_994696 [Trametes maxima]
MARGTPLDKILNPRLAFRTLRDASYGLFIMHCIGYLHRDPSAPNILLTEAGIGVLADLELGSFMSAGWELLGTTWLSRSSTTTIRQPNDIPLPPLTEDDDPDLDILAFTKPAMTSVPWTRCELHDVESFFLIALWLMFRHTSSRHVPVIDAVPTFPSAEAHTLPSPKDNYDLDAHHDMYNRIFPDAWNLAQFERRDILCVRSAYQRAFSVLPPSFRNTALYFEYIRRALFEQYDGGAGRVVPGNLWDLLHRLCANGASFMPEDNFGPLSSIAIGDGECRT